MSESEIPKRQLYFAKIPLDERQIFYETENIIGFVNISPILRDHVLVIPKSTDKMGAPKVFSEMTHELVSELYIAVHTIQRAIIDNREGIEGFNIAMQDGEVAGQSVPHVHVHILPRKGGEFIPKEGVHQAIEKEEYEGDNSRLAKGLKEPSTADSSTADLIRIPRRVGEKGMKEMEAEAKEYRGWFMESKLRGGGITNKIEEIKEKYADKLMESVKKYKKGGKKTRKAKNNKKKGKRTRRSNRK